jgi:hypothetical protein
MLVNEINYDRVEELRDRIYDAIDSLERAMAVARDCGDNNLRDALGNKRASLQRQYNILNKRLNRVYQKSIKTQPEEVR